MEGNCFLNKDRYCYVCGIYMKRSLKKYRMTAKMAELFKDIYLFEPLIMNWTPIFSCSTCHGAIFRKKVIYKILYVY